MIEISDEEFDCEVLKHKGKVVVDFYSGHCMPCKVVAQELLELERNTKTKVVKINVLNNTESAVTFSIMSAPTVMLFEDGRIKSSLVGCRKQQDYLDMLLN